MQSPNPESERTGFPPWMIFLGAMVALTLGANFYFVRLSNRSPHGMAEKDYYQAGLQWDQRRNREARFDSLGIRFEMDEGDHFLRLSGHWIGAPDSNLFRRLPEMRLRLFLKRPNDPDADREWVLVYDAGSVWGKNPRWQADVPRLRPGKWECRVVFEDANGPWMEQSFTSFRGG